uniref:Uncharacterized protein n=1 Tax=viral metagenome TaxID=1070528 RepID=A0A6M3JUX1_9ZZZZ
MVSGKNYDIKTVSKTMTKGTRAVIGSAAVAAGMKRYVTFVRVEKAATNQKGQGAKVFFASGALSNTASTLTLASAAQKLQIVLTSAITADASEAQIPNMIDTQNPLFTIAASKWLTLFCASVATFSSPANVLVQYYDQ